MTLLTVLLVGCAGPSSSLPGRYYRLMEAGMPPVERRLETAEPGAGLAELEAAPPLKDFPSSILAAAVLYTSSHPANT